MKLRNQPSQPRGSALIVATISMAVALTLAYSALSISTSHQEDLQEAQMRLQARALAEAGLQRTMQEMRRSLSRFPGQPLAGLDQLLFDANGNPVAYKVATREKLTKNGRTYGQFSAEMVGVVNGGARDVTITSTGYYPNPARPRARQTVQAVIRVERRTSQIFDYAYFHNNWTWFFGNNMRAFGNVGSNGQFDAAGSASTVQGTPRYESVNGTDLVGYQDDNGDGKKDGNDGGVFSAWDIVNAGNLLGSGALAMNQLDYQRPVSMPNLSDLSPYEAIAQAAGGSLSLALSTGTVQVSDAVLGDGSGELQNLVLIGTPSEPILLNGPVVVRGDVIIKGVVSGQGTIYAGGNIYVPDDLVYLNGPASDLPNKNTEASTEAWLAANQNQDFLGLFAGENLVIGDYTDSDWRVLVDDWISNVRNDSNEDAGLDGIPRTAAGMDGILGTSDDDVLEGDGIWTVEYYSQRDANLGLIPPGFKVGDPIPGSGEDLDGDGRYDAGIQLSDFNLSAPLDPTNWAGNLPASITGFSDLASMTMTNLEAVLYTNHAAALATLATGRDFRLFGGLSSRLESFLWATDSMNFIQDRRLAGGSIYADMLPQETAPFRVLAWRVLDGVDVEYAVPNF